VLGLIEEGQELRRAINNRQVLDTAVRHQCRPSNTTRSIGMAL
jgi:hypothetical protein